MPIINTPLSKDQFEFLQQNISDQVATVKQGGVIAQSGLHYIVLLQVDAPEIDLVNPFFAQLQRTEALSSDANWVPVVSAMNSHVITRGTAAVGTPSARMNAYLENGGNRILVSAEYANLSAEGGIIIDPCYVTPGNAAGCLPGITAGTPEADFNVNTGVFSLTAVHGVAFSYLIQVVGAPTVTITVTGTLPTGVTFDGTATLSGTPTVVGTTTAILHATNALGSISKNLVITIS